MMSSPKHSSWNPSHWFACFGKKNKPKHIDHLVDQSVPIPEVFPKNNLQSDHFEPQIQASAGAKAGIAAIIEGAENEEDLAPLFSQWKDHPEFATILLKSHAQPESIAWYIREEMDLFISRQIQEGNTGLLHRILNNLNEMNISAEEVQPLLITLGQGVARATDSAEARWEWSQAFDKVAQKAPVHKIEDFSQDMMKVKKTSRHLDAYQERLKIPSADLKKLHKQRLCLVGGGYSRIKQDLREQGVKCNVTNVDPICTQHDPENEDTKLPLNFCEPGILKKLNKHGYTEVWALHSLPQYAMSPAETLLFYQNALSLLKSHGVLRITPATGFKEGFSTSMQLSRPIVSKTSGKILEALESRPDLFKVSHHQPVAKTLYGKRKMQGVNIKMIGPAEQVDAFLQNKLPTLL